MKTSPSTPLPPAYQLSSIGDPPVKLALVAATLIRSGIAEEQAIASAHRLIRKAEDYLVDIELEQLLESDGMRFDLDRVMSDLGVKRQATIREYLRAIMPNGAGVIWQKALTGDRVFSYRIQMALASHQAQLRRSRSEKAAAGRRKRGQT